MTTNYTPHDDDHHELISERANRGKTYRESTNVCPNACSHGIAFNERCSDCALTTREGRTRRIWNALTPQARRRTSVENINDVQDAITASWMSLREDV